MTLTAALVGGDDSDGAADAGSTRLLIGGEGPAGAATTGRAFLHVESTPSGATVYIDGAEGLQKTPTLREVPAGKAVNVRVRLTNYEPYETQLTLKPSARQTIKADLKQLMGVLTVKSRPAGAMVSVGGVEKGLTPITVQGVSLDRATPIRLEKDGYQQLEDTITWGSGERTKEVERRLRPVRAEPAPVARAKPRRKKPARKAGRKTGRRTASASRSRRASRGGRSAGRRTASRSGGRESRTGSSGGRDGFLTVATKGAWAEVHLNRRKLPGETPLYKYAVAPGRYRVYVCFEGKRNECTRAQNVEIRAGRESRLRFRR